MNKNIISILPMLFFVSAVCAQDEQESKEKENKRPSWSKGLPERQKSADINTNEFRPEIDTDLELDMSEFGLKGKPKIEIELPISDSIGAKPVNSGEQEPAAAAEVTEISNEPEPLQVAPAAVEEASAENENAQELPEESVDNESALVDEVDTAIVNEEPVVSNFPDDQQFSDVPAETESNEQNEVVNLGENLQDSSQITSTEESNGANAVESVNQELKAAEELNTASDASNSESEVDTQADLEAFVWEIVNRTPVEYPPRAAVQNIEGWVDVEVTINSTGEVISVSPVKYSRGGRIFAKNAVKSVKNWKFKAPNSEGINTNLSRIYKIEFDL